MSRADDLTKSLPIRPYRRAWVLATTAMLILALGAVAFLDLYSSYQDVIRHAKTNLLNLSNAFAAQTFSVAQAIDNVMLESERDFPENATELSAPQRSSGLLGSTRLAHRYLMGIHLYDTSGRLIASALPPRTALPPPSGKARSIVDMKPGALRVTIGNIDRATGRGVVSFSRDTVDAAGKRTGTIVAQADSERLEAIYRRIELGKYGSVTLFNRDGTMLVRGPNLPSAIGTSFAKTTTLFGQHLPRAPGGAYIARSPEDGRERLYGYRAVGDFPLVVLTATDMHDVLALWYGRLRIALALYALISTAIILLAWRIARDSRRTSALIGELRASEARAEKSAEYLGTILNAVGTPIWVLDRARKIVMHNKAFSRFVGRGAADLAGQHEADALDHASSDERDARYREVLDGAGTIEATTSMRDGGGDARTVIQLTSTLHDAAGQPQVVSVLTDITERRRAEQRLAYVANFDLLTGLPNQVQFRRVLEAEIAGAGAGKACFAVLLLSLERLQEITDLLGHEAGEGALRQIAQVFQSLLPHAKCVARIKSNEFAVLVEADAGRAAVEQYAIDLLARLAGALRVGEREFYLGPVMGVSMFPEDGELAEELIRRADSARGRTDPSRDDTIRFFSERAQTDLDERLRMEAYLRRAVEHGELRLLYQPKVEIASGRVVGFEALVRWTSPELGEVSPVRFIPIAERTGLIVQLGAWTLQEACRQIQRWNQAGTHAKVAVNLSPRQFHQKDLLPTIRQCLEDSAIDPASLELEITETALMSHEQEVDALMHEIRALGIELSIDDFGTGYSSLAYLKRFPVQRLKVDRAFIRDLGKDKDSAAIVSSVSSLGQGLKLRVLAEGVETVEQLELLRSLCCDEYQGYLFSRPVEADAVPALCAQDRAAAAVQGVLSAPG